MKQRYIVPAVFVIHADNVAQAEEIAGAMQSAANSKAGDEQNFLFLNEELATIAINAVEGETEMPHTYLASVKG